MGMPVWILDEVTTHHQHHLSVDVTDYANCGVVENGNVATVWPQYDTTPASSIVCLIMCLQLTGTDVFLKKCMHTIMHSHKVLCEG